MADNKTQPKSNGTFYSILGGDAGVERLVRDNSWFCQPFRRAREIAYLKTTLKNVRTERDLESEFTVRIQDLYNTHNRLYASWIFYNRVKFRNIAACVKKKNSKSQL